MQEFLCLLGTKALYGAVTAIADWFRNAVGAAVHFRHDRCQKGLALRAELIAGRLVMAVAVDAESLSDGGLFFRHVVLYFYRFPFRQETRKNAHVESPFACWNVPCGGTLYILKVFSDKSKSRLTSAVFIVNFISKSILGVVYIMAGR